MQDGEASLKVQRDVTREWQESEIGEENRVFVAVGACEFGWRQT